MKASLTLFVLLLSASCAKHHAVLSPLQTPKVETPTPNFSKVTEAKTSYEALLSLEEYYTLLIELIDKGPSPQRDAAIADCCGARTDPAWARMAAKELLAVTKEALEDARRKERKE